LKTYRALDGENKIQDSVAPQDLTASCSTLEWQRC